MPPKKTKKIKSVVKLTLQAGNAQPVPPAGAILGPLGVNLMQFCKEFNDRTSSMSGPVPSVITVYEDRSFDIVLKIAPTSYLIKLAAGVKSGSQTTGKSTAGKITKTQVLEIVEKKMPDLNCYTPEEASKMVAGTAKSMGIKVVD